MPNRVKPARRYDSTRRRQQAEQTRRDILRAAQRLFEKQGYAATTMSAVAAEAEVALKTVYLAFDAKSGLLRAVWDVLLRGEDEVPVAALDWYKATIAEPDPRRQLRLVAENSRLVKERIGPLLKVIRSAAPVDPDMAALWHLIQTDFHANQGAVVAELDRKGALRAGLDAARATDILWMLNHPDVWHLFADRGWSPDQWEAWFADAAIEQLLRPSSAGKGRPRPGRVTVTRGRAR